MNTLQQEITFFHENLKPAIAKVLAQYDRKVPQKVYQSIIVPGRQLMQKCSFKSLSDADKLCSFAYWLYIYGQKEFALEICEHTHGIDFVYEYFWFGYPELCGLEIRIARELLGENRRNNIPPDLIEFFFSKSVKKEVRYPQILREERIAVCDEKLLASELLWSLRNMIGKGETGLYSELNKNWRKIEETICIYIELLQTN